MLMKERYILFTNKNGHATQLQFKTIREIAEHINTSINTVRQLYAYTNGYITNKPRGNIRTRNFYDIYSIYDVSLDEVDEEPEPEPEAEE